MDGILFDYYGGILFNYYLHLNLLNFAESLKNKDFKETKNPKIALGILALQDGLEPEYMKPTEIIRNYKKLNTNKLHKRIER